MCLRANMFVHVLKCTLCMWKKTRHHVICVCPGHLKRVHSRELKGGGNQAAAQVRLD